MITVSRRGKPPAEGGWSPNWLQPPAPCSRGSFAFIVISSSTDDSRVPRSA